LANRLIYLNFLDGTYIVNGVSYLFTDIVGQNPAVAGVGPSVDVNGLKVFDDGGGPSTSGSYPIIIGAALAELQTLLSDSGPGITILTEFETPASGTQQLIEFDITTVAVPADGNGFIAYFSDPTVPETISNWGQSQNNADAQRVSDTGVPVQGNVINGVYQYVPGGLPIAMSVCGNPVVQAGASCLAGYGLDMFTLSPGFTGGDLDPDHIHWFAAYDGTIDITLFPSLSAVGTVPPLIIGPTSPGPFQNVSPGDIVQIGSFEPGTCGKIEATTVIDNNTLQGSIIQDFDMSIPGDPTNNLPIYAGTWTVTTPITQMTGLWHLEGKTVMGLADGGVVGPFTVVDGMVNLPYPATNVVVGLAYQSQLQTLYLNAPGQQEMQGRRKTVPACTLRVSDSRGPKIGRTFEDLQEMDGLMVMPGTSPMELVTGDFRAVLMSDWEVTGQVCVQQDYPLPLTVLGIIPEFVRGDTST
jgi:hypothetical protein